MATLLEAATQHCHTERSVESERMIIIMTVESERMIIIIMTNTYIHELYFHMNCRVA